MHFPPQYFSVISVICQVFYVYGKEIIFHIKEGELIEP